MTTKRPGEDGPRQISSEVERSTCQRIPRRLASATIVLSLVVLCCHHGYCLSSETLPSKSLRLLIILFRHGARTPTQSYNSDPHKNYPWPGGLGSLTNVGKRQMYELGKLYRGYYANFLPEEYNEKYVYIRSSDKSRCMMSAYTFLAGMFPPSERQRWHPEIPWQPIPVHSLPLEKDNILAKTKPCKVWNAMHKEIMTEQNSNSQFTDTFNYLSEHTNQSIRSLSDIHFLFDILNVEKEAGLQLPDWTKNVFPNKKPYGLSIALLSYNESLQRLHVGPLLGGIKQHLEDAVIHAKVDRTLYVYSGHDMNVVSLRRALLVDELLEPEYGASIALELHEDVEQGFFVKVLYRNNTKDQVPVELKLPFCGDPCSFSQFIRHIKKLIPDDWETECQNTVRSENNRKQ